MAAVMWDICIEMKSNTRDTYSLYSASEKWSHWNCCACCHGNVEGSWEVHSSLWSHTATYWQKMLLQPIQMKNKPFACANAFRTLKSLNGFNCFFLYRTLVSAYENGWSRSSETSVWSSRHSVRLLRCVWGWSAGSMMRKVSRYGSTVSLSSHIFCHFDMRLPIFVHYCNNLFLNLNLTVLILKQSVWKIQTNNMWTCFLEIGKWDIPEVVVYSNSSPWQRDHDQKDPQHHWCRKFNRLICVVKLSTFHFLCDADSCLVQI